ncbi:hypothetical protein J5Y04_27490 [Kitasatospora sp. RG8]|uniref:hypothetical protein n=1 Tax=Kitasatospora sp. RG8 TaxID=2820815 RepID=UPI001AE04EAE|nr:hypothetical protein [Kitasatospora sp. RG8]MBP0453258.1 hypothetical protein [Kitasatospora sp. RG8]
MKRLARTLAVASAAGSLLLLAAPASQAAAPAGSAPCVDVTTANAAGDGQISVCPQGGSTYRVTGFIETSLPYDAWNGPICSAWFIKLGTSYKSGPMVCAQPNVPTSKNTFDYTTTLSAAPTGAWLQQVWI